MRSRNIHTHTHFTCNVRARGHVRFQRSSAAAPAGRRWRQDTIDNYYAFHTLVECGVCVHWACVKGLFILNYVLWAEPVRSDWMRTPACSRLPFVAGALLLSRIHRERNAQSAVVLALLYLINVSAYEIPTIAIIIQTTTINTSALKATSCCCSVFVEQFRLIKARFGHSPPNMWSGH